MRPGTDVALQKGVELVLDELRQAGAPRCYQYDKASPYGTAITELKAEGKCPLDTVHRQVKYLNNIIEADHGKLKRLINPVRASNR